MVAKHSTNSIHFNVSAKLNTETFTIIRWLFSGAKQFCFKKALFSEILAQFTDTLDIFWAGSQIILISKMVLHLYEITLTKTFYIGVYFPFLL